MALPNTAGTPVKVMIQGMWYEAMGDCKPMSNLSGIKVEANACSGSAVFKHTKQVKSVKGIDVKMSIQDYNLVSMILAAAAVSLPIGLMFADLTVLTGPGRIDLGDHDAAEGKASVDMYFDDIVVVAG